VDESKFVSGAVVLTIAFAAGLWQRPARVPFGFRQDTAAAQQALERRFMSLVDPAHLRETHRYLTRSPHPAGSARDRELAEFVQREFAAAGMEDVAITTHDVLLPRPKHVSVEMIRPRAWRLSMHEEPIHGDADTASLSAADGLAYHAYSASGDITAPVVFAGAGRAEDYDWLAAKGVDVRGAIVLVRSSSPGGYRGFKAYTAQQRSAAGILIYSDPEDGGTSSGRGYPDGPWGPDGRIERGGIIYDFIAAGDPLTPGWASLPGAKRLSRADLPTLPRIVSAPISARDARKIVETFEGPPAPASWQGGLGVPYRTGRGPAHVRLTVNMDDAIRPVWTVTGMVKGSDRPDEIAIVGNHRDGWLYGAVDPSSGTAALVELSRALGALRRDGWRPKRSILLASWDAEEFAMTSSTEWGEQHEAWLRDRAIAYLNVDSAASGRRFVAGATPSLTRLLSEAAQAVRDPITGASVGAVSRNRRVADGNVRSAGGDDEIVDDRLGGGSDYTVFVNRLAIPSADLAFDGPYGVYHSAYDTHQWVLRFGDPDFRYHAALTQVWGVAALRLVQADAVPLDPEATARAVAGFLDEIERLLPLVTADGARSASILKDARAAAAEFARSAEAFARLREQALGRGDTGLAELNRRILGMERAFLDVDGLPGRPWYRHVIHAPKPTYEPEVLPGLAAALDRRDAGMLRAQELRLSAALRRAAATLSGR
jgi:N-acetylated-alpha-linked acidic dipeptidase